MSIVADTREPDGHPFQTEELPCGDYVVTGDGKGFIIERKTWTDLVNSIRTGNLYLQLGRCLEQEEYETLLLIEGKRGKAIKYANAKHYELRRFLSSLVAKTEVRLVFTRNLNETHDFIRDLESWIGSESGTHRVRPVEKVAEEDRPQYIVEGLPNVGPRWRVGFWTTSGPRTRYSPRRRRSCKKSRGLDQRPRRGFSRRFTMRSNSRICAIRIRAIERLYRGRFLRFSALETTIYKIVQGHIFINGT